jgi:FkbM family methyltransferase
VNDYTVTTPRGNPARLAARDQTSDLAVIGSSFGGVAGAGLVDEYELASLHLSGRFVDVGAHIGSVSIAVLLDNPEATATLVEPIPENLDAIRANLAANGLTDRATVIAGAVGTNAITYLFEGDELAATNRYIGNLTVAPKRGSTRIKVRRVTLADLTADGPIAALKVDCEGGEWALFAEPDILDIPIVFGEYHGNPGQEGILAIFGKTHRVTFDRLGGSAGNFRAVRR